MKPASRNLKPIGLGFLLQEALKGLWPVAGTDVVRQVQVSSFETTCHFISGTFMTGVLASYTKGHSKGSNMRATKMFVEFGKKAMQL